MMRSSFTAPSASARAWSELETSRQCSAAVSESTWQAEKTKS
jgi:hypothetical protein